MPSLTLKRHKQFAKDLKKVKFTDKQFEKLITYISLLLENTPLPPEAKDHSLVGNWKDFREFHLGSDLMVIYKKEKDTLILVRIGTHNQLLE